MTQQVSNSVKCYHSCSCLYFVGEDDVRVTTFFRSFPPRSTTVDTVTFSLQLDSVAQEINETFTLKLNYDTSLFGLPTDTVVDELVVTIIDSDSKLVLISTAM